MTIENGTAIVLTYVLVSMGVIIAFLLAAFVIGWLLVGCASAAANRAEKSIDCPLGLLTCHEEETERGGKEVFVRYYALVEHVRLGVLEP